VVISLTNGDAYAGKLKVADSGVATPDRDLILEEPARYDELSGGIPHKLESVPVHQGRRRRFGHCGV
jgi:hypothetical protein